MLGALGIKVLAGALCGENLMEIYEIAISSFTRSRNFANKNDRVGALSYIRIFITIQCLIFKCNFLLGRYVN